MGTLAAKKYPTVLAAKAADHTYVVCGSEGKAWSCWGGKTGGRRFRAGQGSTRRADAIAGADERAGITCYLINGVCHQSANRILLPAAITVRGARGYDLSEVVFGAYGRPRSGSWVCRAPFEQHTTQTGDIPECRAGPERTGWITALLQFITGQRSADEREYLLGVMRIYEQARADADAEVSDGDIVRLQLDLFMHKLRHALGNELEPQLMSRLVEIRRDYEVDRLALERRFAAAEVDGPAFVAGFERRTFELQSQFADALDEGRYVKLFGLARGEAITLVDREIAERVFTR